MRVTPLGFCLRVIVNKNSLNLEKTTSRVLSVLLLIYEYIKYIVYLGICWEETEYPMNIILSGEKKDLLIKVFFSTIFLREKNYSCRGVFGCFIVLLITCMLDLFGFFSLL